MKFRVVISIISLIAMLFSSCKKEDDSEPAIIFKLSGKYSLTNVSGGLQEANVSFSKSEIQWAFDTINNIVTVVNGIHGADSRHPYSDLPTGSYSFTLQPQSPNKLLFIKGRRRGPITFSTTGFILDGAVAVDGFYLTFER